MHSVTILAAFAGIATADFYYVLGAISQGSNCAGTVTTCVGRPVIESDHAIDVNNFNCDYMGTLVGTGSGSTGDPICGDAGNTRLSSEVCGASNLYFRINADNDQTLDAATDDGFSNIVATCSKNGAACDEEPEITCNGNSFYDAKYLCTAVNGSSC